MLKIQSHIFFLYAVNYMMNLNSVQNSFYDVNISKKIQWGEVVNQWPMVHNGHFEIFGLF